MTSPTAAPQTASLINRLSDILYSEYDKDDPNLVRRIVAANTLRATEPITGTGWANLLFIPQWLMYALDAAALPLIQLWQSQFKFKRLYAQANNGKEIDDDAAKDTTPRHGLVLAAHEITNAFFPKQIRSLQLGSAYAYGAVESVKLTLIGAATEIASSGIAALSASNSWRVVLPLALAAVFSRASLAATQRGLEEIGIPVPPENKVWPGSGLKAPVAQPK